MHLSANKARVSVYSLALTIKYSGANFDEVVEHEARWLLEDTPGKKSVEWTSSDSFTCGFVTLVVLKVPPPPGQGTYSAGLIATLISVFLERAFGKAGVRTLKMDDNPQAGRSFYSLLVNQFGNTHEKFQGNDEQDPQNTSFGFSLPTSRTPKTTLGLSLNLLNRICSLLVAPWKSVRGHVRAIEHHEMPSMTPLNLSRNNDGGNGI